MRQRIAGGRFRNIRIATRPWLQKRFRKGMDGGGRAEVSVRGRGRWHRPSSSWRGLLAAAGLFCLAAGLLIATGLVRNNFGPYVIIYIIVPCVVGAAMVLSSKLPLWAKLLGTIPFVLVLVASVI